MWATAMPTPCLRSTLAFAFAVLALAFALLLVAVLALALAFARAVRGVMASAAVPATALRARLAPECVRSWVLVLGPICFPSSFLLLL